MSGITSRIGIYPIFNTTGGGGGAQDLEQVMTTAPGFGTADQNLTLDGANILVDDAPGGSNAVNIRASGGGLVDVQNTGGNHVQLSAITGESLISLTDPSAASSQMAAAAVSPGGGPAAWIRLTGTNGFYGDIELNGYSNVSVNRKYALPDKSGTVAMLSDVVASALQAVLTVGNTSTLNIKFLANNVGVQWSFGGFTGILSTPALSNNWGWNMPDVGGIVQVNGNGLQLPVTTKSANYVATRQDHVILCSATMNLTLPQGAGFAGVQYCIAVTTGGLSVTITPASGLIALAATTTVISVLTPKRFVSDGTNYFLIS